MSKKLTYTFVAVFMRTDDGYQYDSTTIIKVKATNYGMAEELAYDKLIAYKKTIDMEGKFSILDTAPIIGDNDNV